MTIRNYRVTFDTQRNRVYSEWAFDTQAENKREARVRAEQQWYASHEAHMFHIFVERIGAPVELEKFRETKRKAVTWGRR